MFSRLVCVIATLAAAGMAVGAPIDRHALVTRHNPTITGIDPSAPFMVGNGNFAFTADITGLQTFQDQYSPLVPLMTQAQWAWHSFPNPNGFKLAQAQVPIKVRGQLQWYPYLRDWEQAKKPEIQWLRENPHRFSLGRLGLYLAKADGKTAAFSDLSAGTVTDLLADPSQIDTLLKRHIIDGLLTFDELSAKTSVETMSGDTLPVTNEGGVVKVDGAAVTETDKSVTGENGQDVAVFSIDRVLLDS